MNEILRIALVQFDVRWHAISQNLLTIDSLIDKLPGPVDLILLPEMFATGFTMQPEIFSEDDKALVLDWILHTSQAKKTSILGTYPWKEDNGYYNRLICTTSDGNFKTYDKHHLFSIGGEDIHYQAGNERKSFDINGWKIFPLICYDIRFPIWCRNDLYYDLIINLVNWPAARNYAWDILLKARAIENQCYVVGVNRIGRDGNGIDYIGNSKVISMKGEIIKQLDNSGQLVCAELNLTELNEFRSKFPMLKDQDAFKFL
jgi:omega-amidase